PVQVVFDALPAGANSSAFGASLQRRFLEAGDIRIESLDVVPVREIETVSLSSDSAVGASSVQDGDEHQVRFTFSVSTGTNNAAALKDLLVRIERSIRPINLTHLTLEVQGERLALRAEGHTHYQPVRTADLKDKVVKP